MLPSPPLTMLVSLAGNIKSKNAGDEVTNDNLSMNGKGVIFIPSISVRLESGEDGGVNVL